MSNKKLEDLIKQKQKLLEDHPELQEFQDMIDRELDKVGNDPIKRCNKIMEILLKHFKETQLPSLQSLTKMLDYNPEVNPYEVDGDKKKVH